MNGSPALERALAAHQAGRLAEAHRLYRSALEQDPENGHASHLLGVLMHQAGRQEEAEALIRRALTRLPELADAWCHLAMVQRARGRLDDALESCRKALELDPGQAAAWQALGNVHADAGHSGAAERAYHRALELEPGNAEGLFNLAALLLAGRRLPEAETAARQCVDSPGAPAEAFVLLAEIRLAASDPRGARAWARRGLERHPSDAELWHALGFALSQTGELVTACESFERCLREAPEHGGALAALLFNRRRLCDWRDLDRLLERCLAALARGDGRLTPFSFLAEPATRRQQKACARLWTRQVTGRPPGAEPAPRPPARPARDGRLTVAYLSADYHRHPTAYLTAGLFEAHDRARFRVLGYSTGPDDDSEVRQRLQQGFDEFTDLRDVSPKAAAEKIRQDGVDILVDLKGHTLDAPTAIPALRPAPVQVQYLGYPGTMGADFIDYVIGDAEVTPRAHQADFDEHIVQLPGSYQVNDRQRPHPPAAQTRTALGLPAHGTVFCCFNNSWKIGPGIFDAWMHLLHAVPDGVLWILGRESLGRVADNLRRAADRRGVDPSRLVFSSPRPLEDYLALYHHADLFLDTLPYNAHTTASDALWMGCPVLTVRGDSFAGRVGASLLRAAGLAELVCDGTGSYIERAIELARTPDALRKLRTRLESRRLDLPLFDTPATTRSLERAYLEMHRLALHDQRRSFRVTADLGIADLADSAALDGAGP